MHTIREAQTEKLIILGSGPAGYTAAIYAARANINPLLITGMNLGGQLTTTNSIENWPGDHQPLHGEHLMERMRIHAEKFNARIIFDHINSTNFSKRPFTLISDNHHVYHCHALIIATGATAKYLGLPSETLFKGKGVSSCATCDGFFFRNQQVAVVGGGNTAVEEALYLSEIAKSVTLIHRGNKLRAEQILINRIQNKIQTGSIVVKYNYIIDEILGDKNGVKAIKIITNNDEKKIEIINVTGCFIAIGHKPNTEIFSHNLDMRNGYIQTGMNSENYSTMTSIPGIFAAGDVQDSIYRQAITSAGSGCMAALDAVRFLEKYNI